jgi:hypothetical protein
LRESYHKTRKTAPRRENFRERSAVIFSCPRD